MIRWSLAAAVGIALLWFALPFCVPLPERLMENPQASPLFLDRHGEVISRLTLPDSSRAAPISIDQIPPDLIACTLAAEDKRFYDHGGIDLLATVRAARDFVLQRRIVSGASTITQQLIKISSPPGKRGLRRKCYEALAARQLEMRWTKPRILSLIHI